MSFRCSRSNTPTFQWNTASLIFFLALTAAITPASSAMCLTPNQNPVSGCKKVTAFSTQTGACVDTLVFVYSDGTTAEVGQIGGDREADFNIPPNEYIITVRVWQKDDRSKSVQVVTNTGRESLKYGGSDGVEVTWTASPGNMFTSATRNSGTCGLLLKAHFTTTAHVLAQNSSATDRRVTCAPFRHATSVELAS